jgi:Na/Pi-cotransporter
MRWRLLAVFSHRDGPPAGVHAGPARSAHQTRQQGANRLLPIGGLALFLYGMEKMTDGLKAAAGKQMNTLLAKLTGNPVLGAITGAIVTAVIQSSSVTTVLVVGFVSAGLMTLVQSVGVIFGANVGTTVTAQIVAFNTTALAYPLIAIGFVMTFVWKQGVARHYGAMLMGLGLIFYGMAAMGSAMSCVLTRALRSSCNPCRTRSWGCWPAQCLRRWCNRPR